MLSVKRHGLIALILGLLACGIAANAAGAAHKTKKKKVFTKTVKVVDDYYAPTNVTLKKGNAINWVWSKYNYDSHNVTLMKGPKGVKKSQFKSVTGTSGIHFKRTFVKPGTYHFECTIHPATMYLTVIVKR